MVIIYRHFLLTFVLCFISTSYLCNCQVCYAQQRLPTKDADWKQACKPFDHNVVNKALHSHNFVLADKLDKSAITQETTVKSMKEHLIHVIPTKVNYFNNLRAISKSPLTGVHISNSNVFVSTPVQRALFIGNSIVREISSRYAAITLIKEVFMVKNYWGVQPLHEEKKSIKESIIKVSAEVVFITGPHIHHLLRATEKETIPPPIKTKIQKPFHSNKFSPAPSLEDFATQHSSLVYNIIDMLSEISIELSIPIVYIGMIDLDTTTMFLEPVKHNWPDYLDLSLSSVMVDVEKAMWDQVYIDREKKYRHELKIWQDAVDARIAAAAADATAAATVGLNETSAVPNSYEEAQSGGRRLNPRGRRDGQASLLLRPLRSSNNTITTTTTIEREVLSHNQHQPTRPTEDKLYYFEISQLSRACSGVRCDGMHFAAGISSSPLSRPSPRASWGCYSAPALWDGLLGEFLNQSFSKFC